MSNNRDSRYTYTAGDVLNDGIHTYSYDDEGRIITASLVSGGTESYAYDAEGQRIRKTDGTTPIEYIYDKDGRQVGEMASNGNLDRMEIYAGSRHLATVDGVLNQTYFSHSDWQGSERVRTLWDGSIYQTCTNLPYGDGQTCSAPPNGAPDPTPLHYTGKMYDAETALDYFGARYYNSNAAHWMSPDWAAKPTAVPYATFGDPQTLNLYGMVTGNPVSRQDSDGHLMTLAELHSWGGGAEAMTEAEVGYFMGVMDDMQQAAKSDHQDAPTSTQEDAKKDWQKPDRPRQGEPGGRQLDPNGQECRELANKIEQTADRIGKRLDELEANKLQLPKLEFPGSKPRETQEGHVKLVQNDLHTLGSDADRYNNMCGGGPPPTGNAPSTSMSPSTARNLLGFGGGFAVGAALAVAPEITIPVLVIGAATAAQ